MDKTSGRSGMWAGFFTVALAGLAGCGDAGGYTATVEGKVTFQGKPVTDGQVRLFAEDIGVGASTDLGAGGAFKVAGEIKPGTYTVTVTPPAGPAPLDKNHTPRAASYVPAKYRQDKTSDLKVDVRPGVNELNLDLKP